MEKAVCGPRLCTDYQRGWARAMWGGGSPPNTERCGSSASLGCLFEAGENGVGGHEWRSVAARLCENLVCAADGPSGRVASGLRPLVRPHRQRGTSRGPWGLRGHEVVRQEPHVLFRQGLLGPAHSQETPKKLLIRTGNVINSAEPLIVVWKPIRWMDYCQPPNQRVGCDSQWKEVL